MRLIFKCNLIYYNRCSTGTDAESDDRHAEEEASLRLPQELAELLRSDTEDEEFNGLSDFKVS